jgi:hypothetical protein
MELCSQHLHVLDDSTRSGWDGGADQADQTRLPSLFQTATSGAARDPHVPMAFPVRERTSPSSARPRPKEPDINNPPPGVRFHRGRAIPVSSRRPAPLPVVEQQATTTPDGWRDMLQDESATVNMAAMLLAVSRWNSACFPVEQWKLVNQSHQLGLLPLLTNGAMTTTIDKMLKTNNHNHKPVLLVAAADNFAEIRRRISTWEGFDISGLEQVHNSGPSITTCAQLQLQSEGWPTYLSKETGGGGMYSSRSGEPVTGWAKEGGVGGETLKFPNRCTVEGTPRSRMERDGRGLVMGTYQLSIGGYSNTLRVEVRTTHIPSGYQDPVSLQSLVTEHASEAASFTQIPNSEMCGYEFHAIRCRGSTNSIRPIQGATNGDAQVTAIQAITDLQINKATPLNLTAQTVAVVRCRGWTEPDRSQPYQMFETLDGKTWFNNLVEVLVDGQLVFATMTKVADTQDSDR